MGESGDGVAALVILIDFGDVAESGFANVGGVRSPDGFFFKQQSEHRIACASNLADGDLGIFFPAT